MKLVNYLSKMRVCNIGEKDIEYHRFFGEILFIFNAFDVNSRLDFPYFIDDFRERPKDRLINKTHSAASIGTSPELIGRCSTTKGKITAISLQL
jgi:hypothetical protein